MINRIKSKEIINYFLKDLWLFAPANYSNIMDNFNNYPLNNMDKVVGSRTKSYIVSMFDKKRLVVDDGDTVWALLLGGTSLIKLVKVGIDYKIPKDTRWIFALVKKTDSFKEKISSIF